MLEFKQIGLVGRVVPFSAKVDAGQQVHLIGPNGAGKSSLLALIAGMLHGDGEIILQHLPLTNYSPADLAKVRGYLCQQQSSHSMMPVFQYLSLHLLHHYPEKQLQQTIEYLSDRLDLNDKLAKPTMSLSGGEWQRVRLAAIFLQVWPDLNPDGKLLLLDEPLSSLDIAQQAAFNAILQQFCQLGGSAIVSTHDLNHTLHMADSVWLMNKGHIIAQGSVEAVITPKQLSPVYNVNFQLHQLQGKRWIVAESE